MESLKFRVVDTVLIFSCAFVVFLIFYIVRLP